MSAKTSSPASIGDRLRSVLKRQVLNKNLKPHLRRIPEEQREAEYLRLASRIGARYASCTLDTYELSDHENQREVFGQVEKYAADMENNIQNGSGIIMYGRCGTGKDHLVVAVLYQAILDHGFTCDYIRGSSFFESLRAAIGDGVPEKEVIRALEKPLILALSDPMPPVGATSNFQTDALFRLIDSRYRQNKVTFATMNVDNSAEAQKRLSAQIVDRLTHNALTLSFDWQSYRRK